MTKTLVRSSASSRFEASTQNGFNKLAHAVLLQGSAYEQAFAAVGKPMLATDFDFIEQEI